MKTAKFWPLDFDQEVEIYDNPSWNLPGMRTRRRETAPRRERPPSAAFSCDD